MAETMQEMIAAVRAHALKNYERGGWDFIVECWDDKDLEDAIGGCQSSFAAIRKVRSAIKPLAERRDEVRAEIF
jgi:hypothetical protein